LEFVIVGTSASMNFWNLLLPELPPDCPIQQGKKEAVLSVLSVFKSTC
jgi:hypothetical protein